ncbi:MAG: TRAP transporter small permease [Gammaproteobacteria bacterium]
MYHAEASLAALSLLSLLLLSLAQIAARNLFHTGLPLADSLTRYLVLYVAMLGAVLATEEDRHIKIDVGTALLPRLVTVLQRPFHILSAVVCTLLSSAAWHFWREEWQYAATDEHWIAALEFILPFGFGLLALHFLILGLSRQRHHGRAR